jgi:hypothetical protein
MRLKRNKLLILLIFPLLILACTSRKNKLDKSDRIPTDDLTNILTEISMTNGLLTIPRVHRWYTPADTMAPYEDVIKKFGYEREDLDKTLKWYFVKNPKKLEKIFDNVLARLSEMESRYDQELSAFQAREANLWRGKEFYASPVSKGSDSTNFKVRLSYPGVYQLTFMATVYPDDHAFAPRLFLYTTNPDSSETGKRHYVNSLEYIRDGLPHYYYVNIKVPDQNYFNVMGSFMNYCMQENPNKHFLFENIAITKISGSV